jgi:hypothetical protein
LPEKYHPPGLNQLVNTTVAVDGDPGVDSILIGTGLSKIPIGPSFIEVHNQDTDIEKLSYADRAYFDLVYRYRDAFGFVISEQANNGKMHAEGDAVMHTGLAMMVAAMRGDDKAVREFLETIRDFMFTVDNGEPALIRHPLVMDYDKDGNRLRYSPVTKDGIVGLTPGLFFAYTSSGTSNATKSLAKEIMGQLIDYFIDNHWWTIFPYPSEMIESAPKERFANIYGPGGEDESEKKNRIQYKGKEGYLLAPHDRYAIQYVASEMGFSTAAWAPVWPAFLSNLLKEAGDEYGKIVERVADDTAKWVAGHFDRWLAGIDAMKKGVSFHVIPGIDWTKLSIELRIDVQSDVSVAIEESVRAITRLTFQEWWDGVSEVPAYAFRINDLLASITDKIVDGLPGWAGADSWKPAITKTIQQIMPWFTGEVFTEVDAFAWAHRVAKGEGAYSYIDAIANIDAIKHEIVHLVFWPTYVAFEARPDLASLIQWSVNDLNAYANGPTIVSPDPVFDPNKGEYCSDRPSFCSNLASRMDMMLFDWMADGASDVGWWLKLFETEPAFSNIHYARNARHYRSDGGSILGELRSTDAPTDWQTEVGHNRLDYLLLLALNQRDRPDRVDFQIGDWLKHWDGVFTKTFDAIDHR